MEDTFEFKPPSLPNIELSNQIHVQPFTTARSKEIQIIKHVLASAPSGSKLAFQKLPNHMRRRAMSHNAKRLPRKLRQLHLSQMRKSGLPPKQKRPSRKYRRKPRNLLAEYTKRQAKIKWLFTHIWHAKRFHMINKWGYRIPYRSCDKSFRFSYRAMMNHCLLQDISYIQCVELHGNVEFIVEQFSKISNFGLSIGAKSYIKGFREGSVTLFNFNKKPIGLINFQWKYNVNEKDNSIWLWIHSSFYKEVMDILVTLFDLLKIGIKSYKNISNSIKLYELHSDLCRFRLEGALSNSVVRNCFKCFDIDDYTSTKYSKWYDLVKKSNKNDFAEQMRYFNQLNISTSLLPKNIIVPLLVHDPRFNLPKKRTKPINETYNADINVNESLGNSVLWIKDIRDKIKENKPSSSDISLLNQNKLVPGSNNEPGCPVPIILIQRPGTNTTFKSGWDIITHSSWAQTIWVSLIMWGARPGGLRESVHSNFEIGKHNLYPDTNAGESEEEFKCEKCKTEFFKKPPNKRTNFAKFGIVSPFRCDWKMLVSEWSDKRADGFSVLRDRNKLEMLQEALSKKSKLLDLEPNFLIPIQIDCVGKGSISDFAIICLPLNNDLKIPPSESKKIDTNSQLRKKMRLEHKSMLKRLRQKRKRARKLNKPVKKTDREMLMKYTETMRDLWLPQPKSIRKSCSREVVGFVNEGGFSFMLGRSKGIGYIASGSLPYIHATKSNKLLVRNTNSLQYFVCNLKIITEL